MIWHAGTIVPEVRARDIVVGVAAVGDASLQIVVSPLQVATQLGKLYAALQETSDTANIYTDICKAMARKACNAILCKLLSVGNLFPEDHTALNSALHSCL